MVPLPDFEHPGTAVTRPSFLAHVVLRTNNYDKMVAWYTTFLGGRVTFGNEWISFITYDHEHHRIAIMRDDAAGPGTGTGTGLDHVAFTFADLPSLLLAYRQRQTHHILPQSCMNHGPTTSLYYRDPDGNGVETQTDNFASAAEANAFMESPAFTQNPVGTVVDPDDLIRRLVAGESAASLQQRDEAGVVAVPRPRWLTSRLSVRADGGDGHSFRAMCWWVSRCENSTVGRNIEECHLQSIIVTRRTQYTV